MSEPDLRTKACPICGKPALETFRPFCSRRCADVDLNRWLSGVYAVRSRKKKTKTGRPPAKPDGEASGT
jgi:uncharacterized protein